MKIPVAIQHRKGIETGYDRSICSSLERARIVKVSDPHSRRVPAGHADRTIHADKMVYAILDSYRTICLDSLFESVAENFTHRVLSRFLDMLKRDKKAFTSHAAQIYLIFTSFDVEP